MVALIVELKKNKLVVCALGAYLAGACLNLLGYFGAVGGLFSPIGSFAVWGATGALIFFRQRRDKPGVPEELSGPLRAEELVCYVV